MNNNNNKNKATLSNKTTAAHFSLKESATTIAKSLSRRHLGGTSKTKTNNNDTMMSGPNPPTTTKNLPLDDKFDQVLCMETKTPPVRLGRRAGLLRTASSTRLFQKIFPRRDQDESSKMDHSSDFTTSSSSTGTNVSLPPTVRSDGGSREMLVGSPMRRSPLQRRKSCQELRRVGLVQASTGLRVTKSPVSLVAVNKDDSHVFGGMQLLPPPPLHRAAAALAQPPPQDLTASNHGTMPPPRRLTSPKYIPRIIPEGRTSRPVSIETSNNKSPALDRVVDHALLAPKGHLVETVVGKKVVIPGDDMTAPKPTETEKTVDTPVRKVVTTSGGGGNQVTSSSSSSSSSSLPAHDTKLVLQKGGDDDEFSPSPLAGIPPVPPQTKSKTSPCLYRDWKEEPLVLQKEQDEEEKVLPSTAKNPPVAPPTKSLSSPRLYEDWKKEFYDNRDDQSVDWATMELPVDLMAPSNVASLPSQQSMEKEYILSACRATALARACSVSGRKTFDLDWIADGDRKPAAKVSSSLDDDNNKNKTVKVADTKLADPLCLDMKPTPESAVENLIPAAGVILETSTAEADTSRLNVYMAPGLSAPLRDTQETLAYVVDNRLVSAGCFSCQSILYCMEDAEFMLCPVCRVCQPVGGPEGGGTGMGLTAEDYHECKLQEGLTALARTASRRTLTVE